jgi:cation diffusion facilitator CzcD-associated flavoprotein CzcO
LFATGAEFSICDITVQTFPVPHDAVDPLGFVFHAGSGSLGFITDLGYVTKLITERLRKVQTLVVETNHDEKLLQNDTHRPWPVKQRIQSRHGHLSNAAAAIVIEGIAPRKYREGCARASQPRLQQSGARFKHGARIAREVRQERRRNLLRDAIRNQSSISDRRH